MLTLLLLQSFIFEYLIMENLSSISERNSLSAYIGNTKCINNTSYSSRFINKRYKVAIGRVRLPLENRFYSVVMVILYIRRRKILCYFRHWMCEKMNISLPMMLFKPSTFNIQVQVQRYWTAGCRLKGNVRQEWLI